MEIELLLAHKMDISLFMTLKIENYSSDKRFIWEGYKDLIGQIIEWQPAPQIFALT